MNVRADDASRNIQDMTSTKSRLEAENADLARHLQEVEMQVNTLSKQRASLQKALDDVKSQADEEARVRGKLQGDNRFMLPLKLLAYFCDPVSDLCVTSFQDDAGGR